MSWASNHPNWRAKAQAAGWSAHDIYRVGIGMDPRPQALKAYKAVKGTGAARPAPAPAPGAPAGPPPITASTFNQGAFDQMANTLNQYGLGTLQGVLRQLMLDGNTDPAQLTLALQNTNEWKTRFAGNEALRQKGRAVMSVDEYLSVERSYAQALKQYGLPPGFYDDPSDFAKWIGNEVSPNEVMQRAQMWSDIAKREDPAVKNQLYSMGFTDGDLLAFMMDPARAQPLIQQKYQTTLVGAAARRAGVVTDNAYATHLADIGVTEEQANRGFGAIAQDLGKLTTLAQVYGVDYNQSDFEKEIFESDGKATNKRKRLASQERAAFSGSSGITRGSLTRNTAGQF